VLIIVTLAPAIAAPVISVTDPAMALVVSPCPQRETVQTRKIAPSRGLGMPKL
jgi:hypothetical protein